MTTPPAPRRTAHIGTISVESGTVTIGDPCYMQDLDGAFNNKQAERLMGWQGVDPNTIQLIPGPFMANRFVAFPPNCLTVSPAWGDGEYNVFGTFVTIPPSLPGDVAYERLASVEIVFIEEEGESADADADDND